MSDSTPGSTGRLLTAADLADKLRCSIGAIAQQRHRGELPPAIKFGRRTLWREADIEVWLNSKIESGR